MKLNRSYILTIEGNDGQEVVIEYPLTISFDITRNTDATVNNMNLQIKNLSQKVRDNLFQDRIDVKKYRKIRLEAGYSELSLIFSGNILEAYSFRNGSDIDTNIVALDGGFDVYNSKVSATFSKGIKVKDLLNSLVDGLPNTNAGIIDVEGDFKRPPVIEGNAFTLIDKYSKGKAFIDNETLHILDDNKSIDGLLPLINSETGLLGTPRRMGAIVEIETIFEPRMKVGQLLEVQSSVAPAFDGQYKVVGIKHAGTISGAVGGELKSTFKLLVGSLLFGKLEKAQ